MTSLNPDQSAAVPPPPEPQTKPTLEKSHLGRTILTIVLLIIIALLAFAFLGIISVALITTINPAAKIRLVPTFLQAFDMPVKIKLR